jgi:uncharacterized membrane protein YphA (DoxX/SURF4 family)
MAVAALEFRFLIGAIFLFAGLAKLATRPQFAAAVHRYALLPQHLEHPVALWLPFAELLGGLLLLVGLGVVYASAGIAVVLLIFSFAVGISLLRGERFDCGCRALGAPRTIGWPLVGRNALLATMAVLTAIQAPRAFALDAAFGRSASTVSSSDAFALLLAACSSVLVLTLVQEAISLKRSVALRQGQT